MKALQNVILRIYDVLVILAGFLVLILSFLMITNIISRAVFHTPISSLIELIQYVMLFAVAVALGRVTYNDGHIKVSLISDLLKGRGRQRPTIIINTVMIILSMLIMAVFVFLVGAAVPRIMATGGHTATLQIPDYLVYIVIIFGSVLMVISLIMRFIEEVLKLVHWNKQNQVFFEKEEH